MKFKIRFADQIVGVFVLVAVAFLAVVLILIGANQRWFAKDYHFHSKFLSAEGLAVGMPITFKGFQIGSVDRVNLEDDDTVTLRFRIYDTYLDKVRRNSVLELVSSPLGLGGGLVFQPGKDPSPPLPEGSFIPSVNSPEGRALIHAGLVELPPNEDTVTRIIGQVDPILRNIDNTLVTVNSLVKTIDDALAGRGTSPSGTLVRNAADLTGQASSTVSQVTDRLDKALDDLDSITNELQTAAASPRGPVQGLLNPQGSVEKLLNDNDEIYNHINDTLANLDATMKQLTDFIQYLNASQPQISGILDQGREALSEGKDVLEGIRNNPLIRGGVQPTIEQPNTSSGYRDGDF